MSRFSVKAYGAVGDAKQCQGTIAVGTPNAVSLANPWKPSDVGKKFYGVADPITQLLPLTKIDAFVDAGHVTLHDVAAFSATGLQPADFTWYSADDSDAFLRAGAAAETQESQQFPGQINVGTPYVESGGYVISKRVFQNTSTGVSWDGDGKENAAVFCSPFATIPGDGSPVIGDLTGFGGAFKGFTLFGPNMFWNLAADQSILRFQGCQAWDIALQMLQFGTNAAVANLVKFINCHAMNVSPYLQIQPGSLVHGSGNLLTGLNLETTAGNFNNASISNFDRELVVKNCQARTGVGTGSGDASVTFLGGLLDESGGSPSVEVLLNSFVNFIGTTLWAPVGVTGPALHVDGTSFANLIGAALGPFNTGAPAVGSKALLIDAGGQAAAAGTKFWGNDPSGVCVDNLGTFYDSITNQYGAGAAAATVAQISWRKAMLNPNTVWRD